MNIQSMTAFAHEQKEIIHEQTSIRIDIQLKSLNGKSCDVSCRIPHMFSIYEFDFIKQIKAKCIRGTVFCNIKVDFSNTAKPTIINTESATSYYNTLKNLQANLLIKEDIEISDIINLPGVLTPQYKDEELGLMLKNHVAALLDTCIDKLTQNGKSEGHGIGLKLLEYINHIQATFVIITQRLNSVLETKKKTIEDKVNNFCKSLQTESRETLDIELFRQTEKLDVAEETQRFTNHLENLKNLLASEQTQKGRKIDFICQELSREINTLGVKTNDSHISQDVIEIKVHLEKIREQSHNLV